MSVERTPRLDPPIQAALDEMQRIIRCRYPMANFDVTRGDDPEGFYLKATVDLADVEEIVDQGFLDRLFEFQVEQNLPVYVIPLQPVQRVLAEMQKRPARSVPHLPLVEKSIPSSPGQGAV